MKKNIIVFIIGISITAVIFQLLLQTDQELSKTPPKRIQTQTVKTKPLGQDILDNQVKKLAKNVSTALTNEQLFISLNNYKTSTTKIINSFPKAELNLYLKKISNELNECLKKDFCGTTPDADGYFDEGQTPGHKLLARSLQTLNELEDLDLEGLELESFLEYSNELILSQTAELFSKSNPSQEETISFLKKTTNLDGDNKSSVFISLLKENINKEDIVTELANQLKNSDNYSIVSFFQRIHSVDISEDQVTRLVGSSCHIKENQISWNSFKHNLGKYSKSKGYSIDVSQTCL
jgi:translation initiation factor 2 beta subunit (eIF-2beta)/eIF-5